MYVSVQSRAAPRSSAQIALQLPATRQPPGVQAAMLFGQSPGQLHANEEHPVEAQLFPLATKPNREQSELAVPPVPVNPPVPAEPPVVEVADPPPPVPADPELESSDPQAAVAANATPMKRANPRLKSIDSSMLP